MRTADAVYVATIVAQLTWNRKVNKAIQAAARLAQEQYTIPQPK